MADLHNEIQLTNFAFRTVNGVKRPTVSLALPFVSLEDVLNAGEKSVAYLQEMINTEVYSRVRDILADNPEVTCADNFPWADLTWDSIVNQPAAERKGRGIPKEVWDDFVTDFTEVMLALGGKTETQIKTVAQMFKGKLQAIKFNKPVLERVIADYLTVYASSTSRLEEFSDVVEFLQKKGEEFLALSQEALADAL